MAEYIQPILIALAVLLIPACVKLGVNALKKKMDEGRVIAAATAIDLKAANAEEASRVADKLESNRVEMMTEIQEIKAQTTLTNGKVAEHVSLLDAFDKRLIREEAKTELLTEIFLGRQPDKGL